MENHNLSAGTANGVMDGDRPALASSLVNGRPPDQVPRVVAGPVLERSGSPLAADVQSDNKKLRNQGDVDAEGSVTEMDVEADIEMNENTMKSGDLSKEHNRMSNGNTRLSYANIVGKSRNTGGFSRDGMELNPHKELCSHRTMRGNVVNGQKQNSDNVGEEVLKEAGKEGLFGPWMVVDSRRRRPPTARGVTREVVQDKGSALGSRFAILECEPVAPAVEQVPGKDDGEQQVEPIPQRSLNDVEFHSAQPSRAMIGKKGKVTETGNGSGKKVGTRQGLVSKAVVLPMVEGQQASLVEHTGHNKVHAAVSIFEQGHGKAGNAKIGTGKQVVGKAKGIKENAKQGLKVRKSAEMRTVSRPVLSDWFDNINSQLDSFAMDKELDPGGDTRVCVNQEGTLEKVSSSRSQALSEVRTGEIESSDLLMDLAR
ncbi:hypothetical protein V6N13_002447 [Hibiscus sabdariffa]|uniref:Uncharacterized protein n=1 Tax=Hibiscus sabdariffa TaxID=183260 RepID=A0ABR2C2V6_9ROSI